MLKLTHSVTGRPVYVKPHMVAAICGIPDGDGKPDISGVFLATGTLFSVKESASSIASRCVDEGDEWKTAEVAE